MRALESRWRSRGQRAARDNRARGALGERRGQNAEKQLKVGKEPDSRMAIPERRFRMDNNTVPRWRKSKIDYDLTGARAYLHALAGCVAKKKIHWT